MSQRERNCITHHHACDCREARWAELLEAVDSMRREQRAFFNAMPSTPERRRALNASKGLERRVDEFLAQLRGATPKAPPAQGGLF